MTKKIISKGILLLMGLATIFGLIGCSGRRDNREPESLEYRVSGYNPGYDIKLKNGKIIYENFDEHKKGKYNANAETISELKKTLKEQDVYSWDGFDESDEDVLDGMGFTLYIKFSDGSFINAQGYNMFPDNFREFDVAMRSLMEK